MLGGFLAIAGRQQLRAVVESIFGRIGEIVRQGRQGWRRTQGGRRLAGHAFIGRTAGCQLRLGRRQLCLRQRQPGLGLGHIRPGDLSDFETILRSPQLLGQHFDIVLADLDHIAVAAHIHEGRHGLDQNGLFRGPKRFAASHDHGSRLINGAINPAAAIDRLAG